ncbi:MAG: amino acid adenylation domain-containing protein, partial [Lachnospiraceae bacterium]|nr:amino acid adenylation domain-containing protein [Lachnospiraceae bacterium]
RFRVEIPIAKLLDGASIVDIENLIFEEWMKQGFSAGEAPSTEDSGEVSQETSYPLSSVQLAVYYDAMKREEDTLYNIPMCFAFASIDAERLSEAVKAAVRAHSYINTHFAIINGALSQVRNDSLEPEVEMLSMTEAEFSEYRSTFVRPFNLNAGPLYRFAVVNCKDGKTYLLYDIHHLVFDGFSNGVLLKDIGRAYAGETLTPSAYTYFDYAKEDAAFREGPSYKEESQSDSFMQNLQVNSARPGPAGNRKEAEAYYDSMFRTFEAPAEIPADRTGSAENESVNGQLTEVYQVVSREAVDAFCRGNEVTPSSFFLAVSFYTVSRFAGRRDIYLSTISSGREALKTHKLLGMFVHTLPLAMQFDREMTVKELIDASDTVMKNGIRHQSYPFAELASKYGYTTEIMYECQIGMTAEGGTIGGEAFESIPMRLETPKFKVTIAIVEHGGEYGILVRYNDALYTKEYMETLAESLKAVSERMLKEPSASVKTLSLLSEKEGKIIEGFRQSAKAEIPEKLLHRVFEKQAKAFPDKTALIACDQTLTFKELNETANRISWKLIERGVKRGEPIVLLLPRRSFYFAALFGVLKAGAAFIPCDPEYPTERIQTIIDDSDAAFLITTKERGEAYPEENVLFIEELLTGDKTENPKVELTGEDLAYMIYTSGSTGKPKGVMLKHEGICSFCTLHPANILYDVIDKGVQTMLAVTTVSFDLSLKDTLGVFCNGKTVVFANEEQMNDPIALTQLMNEHKVDAMNGTPSRFVQYLEYKPFADVLSKCALVLAGGEPYPVALLKRLRELGIRDIINTYGPTETTISSNMALLNNAEYISVGRPLLNYSEYIVDLDGNRVPRGVTGELLIGGPGVAKGYRNLPEQTKQRFVLYNGERVYRSGDYAKWDRDGNVLILGRMDGQVKLRGLRIELSEIEGLIEEQDGIVRAVAAVRKLNGQDNLCAWFTAERKIDVQDLRDALAKKLTHYMVPTAIMQVDTIPTTLNGKTDIKALPEPVVLKQGEYEPPVNEIERFFCSLFENVLEVDKVGALDDFFAIGGTSLAATSIMIEATDAGYELKYGDIFKYKTPRELAALFTKEETSGKTFSTLRFDRQDYTKIDEVLSRNTLASFQAGEKRTIGNILLTGATGYMGIHVLAEYLRTEKGTAYCLVRKGRFESAGKRLKNMLVYYFSEEFAEADDRIEAIDGDVTDYATFEALKKFPIDTVFNCAANVKHFSSGTDIEDINVGGAKNCIRF